MAQKVSVQLVDDLDGSNAAETITFGLDGTHYEIDLNKKNATKLRSALKAYVEAGRKSNGSRPKPRTRGKSSGPSASEVRAWAVANGIEVPPVGRLPKAVVDQYTAAN